MGIPQGSVLSGLLCNYFFGHIERCLLGGVLEPPLPPCASRPPANNSSASLQAATTVGLLGGDGGSGNDGGGVGDDGEDGVSVRRRHALGWDSRATRESSSGRGRSCRPGEEFSPARSAAGGKRAGPAVEGVEEEEEERKKGDCDDDDDGVGARRFRATRTPSHRWRAAETDRASRGRAEMPSSGVFPDPEGDCTLLRQVDDFLLVSESTNELRPVPCHVSRHVLFIST